MAEPPELMKSQAEADPATLAFIRATGFLRGRLSEGVDLKRTPDLRFVFEAETIDPDLLPPSRS